jgi:dihydroceramidase
MGIPFLGVTIGSWLFHMTLWYEYQLMDELPMIYSVCVQYWLIFSTHKSEEQSRRIAWQVSVLAFIVTVLYLYYQEPIFHQAAYAILNIVTLWKSYAMVEKHIEDAQVRKVLHRLQFTGIAVFVTGYLIWNLDIHLCGQWRILRRMVGMPYGFFIEGHGWWHSK